MHVKLLLKIKCIAYRVRWNCEKFAMSRASKNFDFHNQENLDCMCAVASYTLAKALRKAKIRCNVISGQYRQDGNDWGSEHCWVEVGTKVVDITATQFDAVPKVYVVDRGNSRYHDGKVKNKYTDFSAWENQKPTPKVAEKILKYA